jgi:hypothetical protein
MFIREGREHVQQWIGFLQGCSQLYALLSVFQPDLSLEEKVRNTRDATRIDPKETGIKWHQNECLYCGDNALLLLTVQDKHESKFIAYLDRLREHATARGTGRGGRWKRPRWWWSQSITRRQRRGWRPMRAR